MHRTHRISSDAPEHDDASAAVARGQVVARRVELDRCYIVRCDNTDTSVTKMCTKATFPTHTHTSNIQHRAEPSNDRTRWRSRTQTPQSGREHTFVSGDGVTETLR
jgi:hypothetical protein